MSPRQASLFDDPAPGPPGFVYRPDLMDPDEEARLAEALGRWSSAPSRCRAVSPAGESPISGCAMTVPRTGLEHGPPIPDFLQPLRRKAADLAGLAPEALVHALVNEYPPGAPIGWHRDNAAFGQVVGFSLLSPCLLRFRRAAGPAGNDDP
jgi:hypothetical protein